MGPVWRIRKAMVASGTERWHLFVDAGEELSFRQVFLHWRADEEFRAFWSASLREVPFDSYCWECPPVTSQNSARPFECVFVSSPRLAKTQPDPDPFSEYFRPDCSVVTFESLSKDALLVAPCPGKQGSNFAHLSPFVATASEAHSSALWKAVGEALEGRVGASPTWLSTAGLGVSWLHVRLDTYPKYYRHAPYKSADGVRS
ncbi:MAG: DUF6940 family protein [Woeseiaceae bacterium]